MLNDSSISYCMMCDLWADTEEDGYDDDDDDGDYDDDDDDNGDDNYGYGDDDDDIDSSCNEGHHAQSHNRWTCSPTDC